MQRRRIRKIKTCLNCGSLVERKFCPECGQENLETRPRFHHLISHFLADLVHYDSGFWRTMKALLFRPGLIAKDYINGKRKTYVEPVKLYIFISFITFFGVQFLPDFSVNKMRSNETEIQLNLEGLQEVGISFDDNYKNMHTEAQFDSIHQSLSDDERVNWVLEKVIRKTLQLRERGEYKHENLLETFQKSFVNNLPKVLFVYLPIFAFSLWLLHNKRRWFYYDHGIFTLYFFSAILLFIIFQNLFSSILSVPLVWFEDLSSKLSFVDDLFLIVIVFYIVYYFFKSHHRFYQEGPWTSVLKCIFLLFTNSVIISFLVLVYTFITFMII